MGDAHHNRDSDNRGCRYIARLFLSSRYSREELQGLVDDDPEFYALNERRRDNWSQEVVWMLHDITWGEVGERHGLLQ